MRCSLHRRVTLVVSIGSDVTQLGLPGRCATVIMMRMGAPLSE